MIDVTSRRWMITGVSTGLGRALMEAALERGERVVGTLRSIRDTEDVEARWPGQAKIVTLDVTKPESVTRAVAEAISWLGGLDVLVNNAGLGVFGPVEVCAVEDFAYCMDVNYYGLLRVTRAALPFLRESKGVLVNVASMAAIWANGGGAPYTAAKHAVVGVSEALHAELSPLGVRVICPLPGGFRTNFWDAKTSIREGLPEIYGSYPCGQITEQLKAHIGHEMGDPVKYANTLIDLTALGSPPLYFVVGADALLLVGRKVEAMSSELNQNRAVSTATAFD